MRHRDFATLYASLQIDSLDVTVTLTADVNELREIYEQLTAKASAPVFCDG